MKDRKIKIEELSLWDENPRFPDKYFNQTEEEIVEFILKKPNFKIKELTEAIVTDFKLPQLEKIIVLEMQDQFVVIEGNRRIATYKLLVNPELTNNDKLNSFFREMSSKIEIDENYQIECIVTSDKEMALKYVDRKHNNNNFEVSWGQAERDNFKARRGRASNKELFRIEMSNIVKSLDLPDELKERVLGKGYITTLYRIIDSTPAYDLFGFSFKDGQLLIKDVNFKSTLKVIVYNVLEKETLDGSKEVNTRTLNKNEEKEEYLNSIKNEDTKIVDEKIDANTHDNIFGDQSINIPNPNIKKSPKTPRTKKLFDKLFSGDLSLVKGDTNDIYRDILDLFKYYITNKTSLSVNFPSLIRMSLRLLVESATNENQKISDYVNLNYEQAKNELSKDLKTTLSNNSIKSAQSLIQLLQSGAHNYSNTANFEQTSAMSIIIGEMLKITHCKN